MPWQAVSMASAGQQLAVLSQWVEGVPHHSAVAICGIRVALLLAALAAGPGGVKAVHGSGAQLHSQVCKWSVTVMTELGTSETTSSIQAMLAACAATLRLSTWRLAPVMLQGCRCMFRVSASGMHCVGSLNDRAPASHTFYNDRRRLTAPRADLVCTLMYEPHRDMAASKRMDRKHSRGKRRRAPRLLAAE